MLAYKFCSDLAKYGKSKLKITQSSWSWCLGLALQILILNEFMYIEGFWAKSEFTKTLTVANVEYNISTNTIWFANVNFILYILEVIFVYSSTVFKHRHILYLQSPVYFCRLENWSIFDRRKLQLFLLAIVSNIYVIW